jgi:hypothetical protein
LLLWSQQLMVNLVFSIHFCNKCRFGLTNLCQVWSHKKYGLNKVVYAYNSYIYTSIGCLYYFIFLLMFSFCNYEVKWGGNKIILQEKCQVFIVTGTFYSSEHMENIYSLHCSWYFFSLLLFGESCFSWSWCGTKISWPSEFTSFWRILF